MSTDVQNNIKVVVRVKAEDGRDDREVKEAVTVAGPRITVQSGQETRSFDANRCYDKSASNQIIFAEEVAPLIDRVCNGYNCFLIAYGSGGSGKAYTLTNETANNEGVVFRAIDALFDKVNTAKGARHYFITVSMWQLRKGAATDLLNPKSRENLDMVDHRAFGASLDPVAELEASSAEEAKELVRQGLRVRDLLAVRATAMGGRPNTVIDLRVESTESGKAHLVRQAVFRTVQLASAGVVSAALNTPLQHFEKVISELAAEKPPSAINFALHKLTRALEMGLGGNALTLFLACVEPGERSANDTFHTLEVAERMRRIRNIAKLNMNTVATTIKQLREEIKNATNRLPLTQPRQFYHDLNPAHLDGVKQLIKELDRVKKQTWEEKKRLSTAAKTERVDSLKKEGLAVVLAESVEVPDELQKQAQETMTSIIAQQAEVDRIQQTLDEKREMYSKISAAKARKLQELQQSEDGQSKEEKKDEKLLKLQDNIKNFESQLASAKNKLQGYEEQYKGIMAKIVKFEAKKKMFQLAGDAAQIQKEKELASWTETKRNMLKDPELSAQLEEIDRVYAEAEASVGSDYALPEVADDRRTALQTSAMNSAKTIRDQAEQLKKMEWERNMLWSKMLEQQFRHEVQLERYQEHMFFIFRNYRSHFEQQRQRLEARYRELLENSVKDALKLADDNAKLRAQLKL